MNIFTRRIPAGEISLPIPVPRITSPVFHKAFPSKKTGHYFAKYLAILLTCFIISAEGVQAEIRTWTGAESSNWFAAANWAEGQIPAPGDDVLIDGIYTNAPIMNLTDGSVVINSLSLGLNNPAILTVSNSSSTDKLIIADAAVIGSHGTLTHTADNAGQEYQWLFMEVTGSLAVNEGGIIDVSHRGYRGGFRDGNESEHGEGHGGVGPEYGGGEGGDTGGGGANAGDGGRGNTISHQRTGGQFYGSLREPAAPGAGGGGASSLFPGGSGGGAVKLSVSGILRVDGAIMSGGQSATEGHLHFTAGGGAGGSILITAGAIEGSGIIAADGGNGFYTGPGRYGGGGSGGRIAVYYGNSTFNGQITAYGGSGWENGAAGTVLIKDNTQGHKYLTIDNQNRKGPATPITESITVIEYTHGGGANVVIEEEISFVINNDSLTIGDNGGLAVNGTFDADSAGSFTAGDNAEIRVSGVFNAGSLRTFTQGAGGITDIGGGTWNTPLLESLTTAGTFVFGAPADFIYAATVLEITVSSGGVFTHAFNAAEQVNYIDLELAGLTIESGGLIDVSHRGYRGGFRDGNESKHGEGHGGVGPEYGGGEGGDTGGGGANAGDGGRGNTISHQRTGGQFYGSLYDPAAPGAGGGGASPLYPGGSGGGAVKLSVSGILRADGAIMAGGQSATEGHLYNTAGGGAGGSILITAGTIEGSGIITADGGNGYYTSAGRYGGGGSGGRIAVYYGNSTFNGQITACGGSGWENGAAGTVLIKDNAQGHKYLTIDNQNRKGPATPITESITVIEYIHGGGANVVIEEEATFVIKNDSLTIEDNGSLTVNGTFTADSATSFTQGAGGTTEISKGVWNTPLLNTLNTAGTFIFGPPANFTYATSILEITVSSGGVFTHAFNAAEQVNYIDLELAGLTIESGGLIDVSHRGYRGGFRDGSESEHGEGHGGIGPEYGGGEGEIFNWGRAAGGGAHGGDGGRGRESGGYNRSGGKSYGSLYEPDALGAGGGGVSSPSYPGGSGGGAVKLVVFGNLAIDGAITADGQSATDGWDIWGPGGGAGGSIWITAGTIQGSGTVSADGGDGYYRSDDPCGGGGAGGRIAVYGENYFTGNVSAAGGSGFRSGEDGTVIMESPQDSPVITTSLSQTYSRDNIFIETVEKTDYGLNNYSMQSRDIIGSLTFEYFKTVGLKSGAFTGRGFFKSRIRLQIGDAEHVCFWNGAKYSKGDKIYFKGSVDGNLSGVMEGTFESYGIYAATMNVARIGNQVMTEAIILEGAYQVQNKTEYPSTQIYFLQNSLIGNISGFYDGSLDLTITHLRIDDESNPYNKEGFGIISFDSDAGPGMGYAYAVELSQAETRFNGLFSEPLHGIMSARLNESVEPKTLSVSLTRLDYGEPPAPDLRLDVFYPGNVSPGQTITYTVEVRNNGLAETPFWEEYTLVLKLPEYSDFVAASDKYEFHSIADWDEDGNWRPVPVVRWDIADEIPAKTSRKFSAQTRLHFGIIIPQNARAFLLRKEDADRILPGYDPDGGKCLH